MSLSTNFKTWLASDDVGLRCLLVDVGVLIGGHGGSETTRYLSDVGYATAAGDTPANTPYQSCVSGSGVQFSRRLDIEGSGGSISYGDIEIYNEDGSLDSWINDIWAGRVINVYLGDAGDATRGIAKWPKTQFELIFSGTVDDIVPKSRTLLSLTVRDIFGPLNSAISTSTVLSAFGGTPPQPDQLLPICLGECFNVTPMLVSTTGKGTYSVHLKTTIQSVAETVAGVPVTEVRDNGVRVASTPDASTATFALTNQLYGTLTCDVQGAKIAGDWRNDVGGLVEWIATLLGDGQFITSGQIDATALTAFRAACPQAVGLYTDGRANRLQTMQQLAASVGATLTTTYDGKLILVRVDLSGGSVGTITTRDMVSGTFGPVSRTVVNGAISLNSGRNWTPQTTLAAQLTAAQLPIFENAVVLNSVSDSAVLVDWKQVSTPVPVDTLLVITSEAVTEANRLLALWKVPHTIYGFDGFASLFKYEIGNIVTLVFPRFGLSGGVTGQIVGVTHDWVKRVVHLEVMV
jgi:hypothetical protein